MQTKSLLNRAKRASASFPPVPNGAAIISVSVRPSASDKHENCGGRNGAKRGKKFGCGKDLWPDLFRGPVWLVHSEFGAAICALCALDSPLHSARSDPISRAVLRSVYPHRISSERGRASAAHSITLPFKWEAEARVREHTAARALVCARVCSTCTRWPRALLSAALAAGANAENVPLGASGWPSFASAAVHCLFCALERFSRMRPCGVRHAHCTLHMHAEANAAIARNRRPAPVCRTAHFATINRRSPLFPSKSITYSAASEPSVLLPRAAPGTMATVIALIIANSNPLKRPHSPRPPAQLERLARPSARALHVAERNQIQSGTERRFSAEYPFARRADQFHRLPNENILISRPRKPSLFSYFYLDYIVTVASPAKPDRRRRLGSAGNESRKRASLEYSGLWSGSS